MQGLYDPARGGEKYPALNDVIAVTICDFMLWPQHEDGRGFRVPMLSRWRNQEQHGGEVGLHEVQYVFLELPKEQPEKRGQSTIDNWAYFFREAPNLTRVPDELSAAPYAQALEVARTANLTEEEWLEYERERMAEQDYRGGIALAERRAAAAATIAATIAAERQTLAEAILTVLRARALAVGEEAQARLHRTEDRDRLARWLALAVTAPSAAALFDE